MPIAAQRLEASHATLEALLLSGGDARLTVDPATGLNAYGCAPRPLGAMDDFSSSTASTISERGYARVEASWHRLSRRNGSFAFDALVEDARAELKSHLGLAPDEADIVFSSSGTDAQLLALFLARATLGGPPVSIMVGADQTGSGAAHAAAGRHFTDRGLSRKGDGVEGLYEGRRSIAIDFCDEQGRARTLAELDRIVTDAVAATIASGAPVLLQAMAASKLGWGAPSNACLEDLARRWPDRIRIVVDACQMRMGTARLQGHLARGHIVMATGSKFFCGPPFSGALLIPPVLREQMAAIGEVAPGLRAYSNAFDWPVGWGNVRAAFPSAPNIGQYLRWEAALEEMRAYRAVPLVFRTFALRRFAEALSEMIAKSSWLISVAEGARDPDPLRDAEFAVPTIFSFMPRNVQGPLSRAQCAGLYRLVHRDRCRIGQPVSVGAGSAALRISSSARLVTRSWSGNPAVAIARLHGEIAKAEAVVERLARMARDVPQAMP
jgi:hypothetical protein